MCQPRSYKCAVNRHQTRRNSRRYANVYGSDCVYCFICMHVFPWRRNGSGGVTGAMCGHSASACPGVRRTDGPTDGWKYHVTASDGLRRELSRAPLRTAGQPLQHPSQFDRRRQPLLSRRPQVASPPGTPPQRTPTGNWKI